jgi:hypothetical protein
MERDLSWGSYEQNRVADVSFYQMQNCIKICYKTGLALKLW